MEKKITSHLQKGLIISLIMIALSIAFYLLGLQTAKWTQYLVFAIFIGGVIWSCYLFSKEMDGNITFGNVFGHGFKTTAVITCLMIVFVLLMAFIFPDMKEKALEQARIEMEKSPEITDEQIETGIEFIRKSYMAFAIGGTLLGYLFFGLIASLIGAGVAKKNPQPSPFQ